jgi:poly(3-hydroxybutyrate) depolymerase
MLERFEGELCIDQSRMFSTGWSYGGMMSLAVGCARGVTAGRT